MQTEFLFVRHAESTANAGGAAGSAADPPLTERGRAQAGALCADLAGHDLRALYTSDTARARATIAPLERRTGLRRTELAALDEWNLGRGGRADADGVRDLLARWGAGDVDARLPTAPYSETLRALHARVLPACRAVLERHGASGGTIIVVAHGGALSWGLPALVDNVSFAYGARHYLGNARSVAVTVEGGTIRATRWNDAVIATV
ncbi:Phosphoglycerate/bisphosphoglycerate mutase [Oceanicola granulosus HTCC2516]|uniref:Phosphoglycerate/bisphosphoglycerate mutase n=1 Tax=Oceanicola granulosus (strain ATCC BAA-861 / DSM 15982 / KCTC 12143 / HTCC2516) TaxID=314256 RepID=Q2CFI3_OCEGH|nr:histidine phosphatase family protein [Oceanicola granulosus]EAR51499.1 Phosphoglycerate/bisphosphoglycerate mutase [Oceanicola granulosus HTCC2516]